MNSIQYYPIRRDCILVAVDPPEIAEKKRLELDHAWNDMIQKSQNLYDGTIFCVQEQTEQKITGFFVPYRFFAAENTIQPMEKSFFPLGVSGITTCNKKMLLGKRAKQTLLSGGYYECVPSGSVESVDFMKDAIKELEEEAHIVKSAILQTNLLGLFYDEKEGIYDIAIHFEVQDEHCIVSSEYDSLEWIPYKEFLDRCRDPNIKIVPLSQAIFNKLEERNG